MKIAVTVQVDATSTTEARAIVEAAGFTVSKATAPRATAGVTGPSPFVRASAVLDQPAGLNPLERRAYVRGYARACMAHVKKNGIPRATDAVSLSAATRQHEWDRHPSAHRAGMTELGKERERAAEYRAVVEARGVRAA